MVRMRDDQGRAAVRRDIGTDGRPVSTDPRDPVAEYVDRRRPLG
jgi:hypothetical protein